jgi:hypothetical protein
MVRAKLNGTAALINIIVLYFAGRVPANPSFLLENRSSNSHKFHSLCKGV